MSFKTVDELEAGEETSSGMLSWTEELRRVSLAVTQGGSRHAATRNQLFYLLHWTPDAQSFGVSVHRGRSFADAEEWWSIDRAQAKSLPFVTEQDAAILRLLCEERCDDAWLRAFLLGSRHGADLLERLIKTGRFYAADQLLPLQSGHPRPGRVGWRVDGAGHQRPHFLAGERSSLVIPLLPPWYLDLDEGVLGPLEVPGEPEILARLFSLPPVEPREVMLVAELLAELAPDLPRPVDDALSGVRGIDVPLVPVLRLRSLPTRGHGAWRGYPALHEPDLFDLALPVFRYGDAEVMPGAQDEYLTLPDGETVRVARRLGDEARLAQALAEAGLERLPPFLLNVCGCLPADAYGLVDETAWAGFMVRELPRLRELGWQIEHEEDFRHHALEIDAWQADLVSGENGWFDLDMGVIVEGKRLPLAPMLAALFQRESRWLESVDLARIPDDEPVELWTPAQQRLRVAAERVKPLARTLIDLFDGFRPGTTTLRVSRFDAQRLRALSDTARWQFRGQNDMLALADRLLASQGVRAVQPPAGLGLELRAYQKEGLAWLQFLREQGLSGILADDMGLGKTAQALAHLLTEKEAGRLDRPALVVLPTSLIFNWLNESARFAPGLSVLALHGGDRKSRFDEIPRHDVVLTTYPLLWRDAEELTRHAYHLLILDEAQTVKSARSRSAGIVRRISARHRVCLTGTPLENHLGELWSQFDFLLPGLLGESSVFSKYWRVPIEKQGDQEKRDLLARRIRPFVLRRRKEEVAPELPAKTIIVRRVELEGAQRDLYEAVRAAMDGMVREQIASKGFGRSQIVILDALLKLRQVCCDPRLVKSATAKRVKERAKLGLLMTMLPELVDEGRRILVFSQFTSMLALIEVELKRAGIDYALLTGDTADREAQVQRFQSGAVPVFLVSLKAGGVGLNLTAADTVIHYDPWWNPAVENQATDRAHRIGQDKPVFVYKLVVAGSIEERILAMQERKAELAAGILSSDSGSAMKFGEDDIAALFSPLCP